MTNKKILAGVTGGIAAYKTCSQERVSDPLLRK